MNQLLLWIRDHKLSTAGLVLVILGCVALVNLSKRVHRLKPRAAVSASAVTPVASVAVASGGDAKLTPSEQAGTEQNVRSAAMRAEFEGAPSYVDFIARARSRPQEGGKFYALLAWKRCNDLNQHKGIAAEHTGSDGFHDAAAALIEGIEKR